MPVVSPCAAAPRPVLALCTRAGDWTPAGGRIVLKNPDEKEITFACVFTLQLSLLLLNNHPGQLKGSNQSIQPSNLKLSTFPILSFFPTSQLAAGVDVVMESHVHIFTAGLPICLLITPTG